jgi:hypothetical protein
MLKEEHTIVGSRPKRRKGDIFSMDEIKANGKIKEEKPLAMAPRSDRGGKFNIPIFSRGFVVFQVLQTCKIVFQVVKIHKFVCFIIKQSHLQLIPTQPKN